MFWTVELASVPLDFDFLTLCLVINKCNIFFAGQSASKTSYLSPPEANPFSIRLYLRPSANRKITQPSFAAQKHRKHVVTKVAARGRHMSNVNPTRLKTIARDFRSSKHASTMMAFIHGINCCLLKLRLTLCKHVFVVKSLFISGLSFDG